MAQRRHTSTLSEHADSSSWSFLSLKENRRQISRERYSLTAQPFRTQLNIAQPRGFWIHPRGQAKLLNLTKEFGGEVGFVRLRATRFGEISFPSASHHAVARPVRAEAD